jgi:hypothetical protein
LAEFIGLKRGAYDSSEGLAGLLNVQPCGQRARGVRAYMEGNMRGPSTTDCEKSYQRTGIPLANMLRMGRVNSLGPLIRIHPVAG